MLLVHYLKTTKDVHFNMYTIYNDNNKKLSSLFIVFFIIHKTTLFVMLIEPICIKKYNNKNKDNLVDSPLTAFSLFPTICFATNAAIIAGFLVSGFFYLTEIYYSVRIKAVNRI